MNNASDNVTIKKDTIEIRRSSDGQKISVTVPVTYTEEKVAAPSTTTEDVNTEDDNADSAQTFTLISRGYFWDNFRDTKGEEYTSGYKWTFYSSIAVLLSYILIAYLFFFNKKNEEEDEL